MTLRKAAAALLGLLLAPVAAAELASPCLPLRDLGCFYRPVPLGAPAAPALLVYLRGWYAHYQGEVPAAKRLESARQAFSFYGLENAGMAVLVTASSHLSVSAADLAGLDMRFERIVVAAHSGGHAALKDTLTALGPVERVLMLDNFYFDRDLSEFLRPRVSAGMACSGYYTAHNRLRYEERFKPFVPCAVSDLTALGHDGAVPKCLASWAKGEPCVTGWWASLTPPLSRSTGEGE